MQRAQEALRRQVVKLPILERSQTARQFVKFGIVGFTNTFWDYFIYLMLTRGWLGFSVHFLLANFLAFIVSVINSYVLNKRWTFRFADSRHHVIFSKFLVVNLITLSLYEALLYVLVGKMGLYDLYGKTISIVVVMAWNFAANKYWTFKERPIANIV